MPGNYVAVLHWPALVDATQREGLDVLTPGTRPDDGRHGVTVS